VRSVPKRDAPLWGGERLWNQVNNPLIVVGMSTATSLRQPTFGTARHPFRATLPMRTLRRLPRFEPEVQALLDRGDVCAAQAAVPSKWRITTQDVKDFLIAYIACFMAVSAWIG
jgi:hypothetical protein